MESISDQFMDFQEGLKGPLSLKLLKLPIVRYHLCSQSRIYRIFCGFAINTININTVLCQTYCIIFLHLVQETCTHCIFIYLLGAS